MTITEYKAYINAKLDIALAEHGDIPVVSEWYGGKLSTDSAARLSVQKTSYFDYVDNRIKQLEGKVFVIGEDEQ